MDVLAFVGEDGGIESESRSEEHGQGGHEEGQVPSFATFGRGWGDGVDNEGDGNSGSLTPVFKRMQEQERGNWGRNKCVSSSSVFSLELGVPASARKMSARSVYSAFWCRSDRVDGQFISKKRTERKNEMEKTIPPPKRASHTPCSWHVGSYDGWRVGCFAL
jgi:hypothetical protein